MSVLFGTTQGRLVPSATGQLQCFPQANWADELMLAGRVGLDYVEWLVEREHNAGNPIWSDSGIARIRGAAACAGLILHSAINDYLLDHDVASSTSALEQTLLLAERCGRLGLRKLVLPLLEASAPQDDQLVLFERPLRCVADAASRHGLEICLESVLPGEVMLRFVARLDRPNVFVCFDTGNRVSLGQDVYGDLALLGDLVSLVHLKDKDNAGTNVPLGSGLLDLGRLCQTLGAIGYRDAYTFETTRGDDPVRTMVTHRQLIEFLLEENGAPLRDAA